MRFDTIVVPRGFEARAVRRGWPPPRPPLVTVAAGAAAGDRLAHGPAIGSALVLGVCGALDPELRVGDTVVYARVVDGGEVLILDAELAAACGVACGRAPLDAASVPRVVGAVAAKAALRVATRAAVIDMEAGAIARALHRRGVRVAMVRVVSDDAVGEMPSLDGAYDAGGALKPLALAAALLRAPQRSARFVVGALGALRALRVTAARLALSFGD